MILESFNIKFQGAMTNEIKNILKAKTNNFDFSRVVKICVKYTTGIDFLLYELNDITKEISKNIKQDVDMKIFVDHKYTNDLKKVEILTSNTRFEWEKQPFLSFKEDNKCI